MYTKKVLLVKYGEISLRKGNRKHFEHVLLDAIRANLKPLNNEGLRVSREQGRFLVEDTSGDLDTFAVLPRIRHIFGIAGFCHAIKTTARDIDDLCEIGQKFFAAQINSAFERMDGSSAQTESGFEGMGGSLDVSPVKSGFAAAAAAAAVSFKVETKRSDKNYPLTSTEISAAIGEKILLTAEASAASEGVPPIKVDVRNPEITLWVEIRNDVYFYVNSAQARKSRNEQRGHMSYAARSRESGYNFSTCENESASVTRRLVHETGYNFSAYEKGEGGLPYGSSGKGVLLLSGGFDSPVAGYLAARRGVEIVAVYFHSPPFVSERAADKVKDICRQLAKYTGCVKLCVVPFTDTQVFLKENVPHEKLTILLKRAMLHIASRLAERERALCLVTGDAVGQVASQTVHSLASVESAAKFPVIRPLATMDKRDIMDMAEKIGTHEISARPYEDCCTVFVAKHPENKPNFGVIEKMEARFFRELSPKMDDALNNAEFFDILP
ncbi:MAG: tRNA sulfurtransferase [Defluviitaleaceae bacterium]|nr:tRNA sulfurtransferase [Defluviitaleaceae bacterium]